jgi:hypothetical protein
VKRDLTSRAESALNKSIWVPLILCLIVVLALPLIRSDVPGERAFGAFQAARDLTGASRNLSGLYSPLFVLPLALAARLGLPIAQVGVSLSMAGWLATLVAVYWIGLRWHRAAACAVSVLASAALVLEPTFYGLLGQDALFIMGWVWTALAIPNLQSPTPALHAGARVSNLKWWISSLMLIVLTAAAIAQARMAPALIPASYGPALIAGLALLGGWTLDRVIALATSWPPMRADKNVLAAGLTAIALAGFGYARGSDHLLERTPFSAQRLALWQQAGAWLRQNSLPAMQVWSEHVDLVGYFSDRRTVDNVALDTCACALCRCELPDYAVVVNSLAWTQRLNQPWFQEHYRPVFAIANPYDSLAPLSIYRYRPSPFEAGPPVVVGARLGESIELMQYRLDSDQLIPGEDQHLTLTWRTSQPLTSQWNVRVRVYDPISQTVVTQVDNAMPAGLKTTLWPVNRPLGDRYTLPIPDDLSSGVYQLDVRVYGDFPEHALAVRGQQQLALAQLEAQPWISDTAMTVAHPLTATFGDRAGGAIELLGYGLRPASDTTPIVERGGGLRVRLYWRARVVPGASYHVFTHLLAADGRLVAQSDGIPVYGTFPTDQWQAGQYILDEHIIPIGSDVPPGRYWLKIGLYTAENGERVTARDAAGREAPERSLPLVQVEVE